jgi:DNA-directed RNA polymerase subunit alpha
MRIRWRGLELPNRVVSDQMVSTPTYGRFVVEPFERGFGITVGNALLRRNSPPCPG